MVSSVLASVLQSYLGQYLELSDTSISVGSEVRLQNVSLKESALSELGLPVRCVHGKVKKLVIKIPWFSLFTSPTKIELEGLHLLVVPSTAVKYNEAKERKEQNEAKQKRLQRAEEAKRLEMEHKSKKTDDIKTNEGSDTFVERLVANVIKNLLVTIKKVHIRFEDKQANSGGYPYAAGITLDELSMTTTMETERDTVTKKISLTLFEKQVTLESLAVYWRPKASMYSEEIKKSPDVIDVMFNTNIGTRDRPITKLKYLLGPICSVASLKLCPSPESFDYRHPQFDLHIDMEELGLSLTKYQYQNFVMLLQSFEYMTRANKFRKYKARQKLEGLPNYNGRWKDVWKFAFNCVYEEEVTRRINNWSWNHMKSHVRRCKHYRELYKQKLVSQASNAKHNPQLDQELRKSEDLLDEVNIRIQRQLAERDATKIIEETREAESKKGFWGWFSGGGTDQKKDESNKVMKKLNDALSAEEKEKLYEVIDYQQNAFISNFPKSFVAKKLGFNLGSLTIAIKDDDLDDAVVIKLTLESVLCDVQQRPSAENVKLSMTMKSLTVTGIESAKTKPPFIVLTRQTGQNDQLLALAVENHPPSDPNGDLDADQGSVYDQRLWVRSNPLEFILDSKTFRSLLVIFHTPDEINLANLQQSAFAKFKEYKESTILGLQYVIENHSLVDVDVEFKSSLVIAPMSGKYTETCPCAVANLGSIKLKSKPINVQTRSLKEINLETFTIDFKKSLQDKAYDKFDITLENMQLLVGLANENWRGEIDKRSSDLFLLKPTTMSLSLQYCLITNDPDLPLCKLRGRLNEISLNISDYRLIKLAQILDSLFDDDPLETGSHLVRTDSNESMKSALSSMNNTGSFIQSVALPSTSITEILPTKPGIESSSGSNVQMTKLLLNFDIDKVNFSLSQQMKSSNQDEVIFHFTLMQLKSEACVRTFDLVGKFSMGGMTCEHLLLKTPEGRPVKILSTNLSEGREDTLLKVVYQDVKKSSPDFARVHGSVLKHLNVEFTSVRIIAHQDAILDIVDKVTKIVTEVSNNAKNLLATGVEDVGDEDFVMAPTTPGADDGPDTAFGSFGLRRQNAARRLNRQSSLTMRTPSNMKRWAFRAKRKLSMGQGEIVDLMVTAKLESVTFDLMTKRISFATMVVKDLDATYKQTKTCKVITAKLIDFQIHDSAQPDNPEYTSYRKIAESMDKQVFDAKVILYDHTLDQKAEDVSLVDVEVEAHTGRVKFVFLMKFINDFLAFVDPFSGAKEIVAEKANEAFEEASKQMIDAYANMTRARLNIQMEAPLVIVPVHSMSKITFMVDLGTFHLTNDFKMIGNRLFDDMSFTMNDLKLMRCKVNEDISSNEIIADCLIVKPISFDLNIKRNMAGSKTKEDPAELTITGRLRQIDVELSRGDYNVLMAILLENFSQKGEFEMVQRTHPSTEKAAFSLPIKSKFGSKTGSKTGSRSSLSSGSVSAMMSPVTKVERDPLAKGVEFNFKFNGFQAQIFSGETTLDVRASARSEQSALAKFYVKLLSVEGNLLANGQINAKAFLENVVLEDSRAHLTPNESSQRIVRLMEAKNADERSRMIDIDYCKSPEGDQQVEIVIHSFVLVGSVSYLLDIANFFVPDQKMTYEWSVQSQVPATEVIDEIKNKMSVHVKIEEPDIFLVENIESTNSDALMLNTQLEFKFWSTGDSMSLMATLTNIRCHTCRFCPAQREATMAQILQPCTLAFTLSQPESHGMRINVNMSDLVLNVAPRSIEIIQNSVQTFIESMQKEEITSENSEAEEDFSSLWKTKRYQEDEFWFLKPEETVEATEINSLSTNSAIHVDEHAIININNLVVKMEAGVGANTIPLLLLESSFSCDVRNWSSSRMNAIGSMNLEMAYYNSKLALWEPVIEPVVQPDGSLKRWDMNITVQSNSSHDMGSAMVSPNFDETDGFMCPENMPPLMAISVQSRDVMQITVTKTLLGVLQALNQSFIETTENKRKDLAVAPFIVQNRLGKPVTILLENKGFKYFVQGDEPGRRTQVELEHSSDTYLVLYRDRHDNRDEQYLSPLREQSEQFEATLRIRVQGERGTFEIPVSKADRRFFPFQYRGDEHGQDQGMVSQIVVENGCKYITLCSSIFIKNHFNQPVNIFVYDGQAKYEKLQTIKPDQSFHVPIKAVYSSNYEFYFQIVGAGQNMGIESYAWRELIEQQTFSQTVQCTNKNGDPDIYLNVLGTKQDIFLEKTGKLSSFFYSLDIRPLLVFKNCLPVTLHYTVGESAQSNFIEPGESGHLQGIRFGHTKLFLKIFEFRNADWECQQVLESPMPELSQWSFMTMDGSKLDLGIHSTMSQGTNVLSIYAPFWMINKTGKYLTYKGQDPQNVIYHPAELDSIPMMFSYTARSFLGKRKTSVRVGESAWSDPFTLDTIEDAGKVTCKVSNKKKDSLGVNINMSKSSLTKIITFTPYYMVMNTASFGISISEEDQDWVDVPPGLCAPFWPSNGAKNIRIKVTGTEEITKPFSMQTVHSTLLMLENRFGAVHVDCRTSASETLLTVSSYKRGLAPVQIVNNTKSCMIEYYEKDRSNERHFLAPEECCLFTWHNPEGPRCFVWQISGYRDEFTNELQSDDQGIVELEHKQLAWVSFLDGMQRVIVFTEDPGLCYQLANTTGEFERIEQEIDISIFGIGISLVNNVAGYEMLYTSITSSDVVWEIRRPGKTRYKSLTKLQCELIEHDFQLYMREKSIGKQTRDHRSIEVPGSKTAIEVNYLEEKMYIPTEGKIKRQFQKGLWLQLRTSQHQRQIHAKINRIQIDNQLRECLFPVIMAPVPPPKSVMAESIPKPFIEMSILEYQSPEHTNLRQYKYFHVLVQELHIKIDQGLINAILELMEEEEILDENINEFLKEDLNLAQKDLKDLAKLRVTQGQKDFYDYLHFSPLKVHVSFSLTSYKSSSRGGNTTRRSNFFSLFLENLGVTITDTDDIIFRLAYFERKHTFYSQQDFLWEMIRHYSSQAIKQIYVIIFGLDVIGNPFGLVVGVSRSVEDLFYEPFQGAVEGPSEFAEGLVIGVRSVFSGVVGGAAGTVSRITGALGKGLASLTFDEKFQNKRREAIKKRGRQNFGESLARGGKGLVMGIFDGVTGVAMKPIEGAKEEGVGGFFKGVGKGVVGLVARPTGGIIDFASGTFDSVKRVTEVAQEVARIRPPRFIHHDGVVRYYNIKEATGNKILKELEKGRYAYSDAYVTHEPVDNGAVLLISTKRIIRLEYQPVLGNWSIDWEFQFHEITGPPPHGRDDQGRGFLIIKPKEERKKVLGLFGGTDTGRRVVLANREAARNLARAIEEFRTGQT